MRRVIHRKYIAHHPTDCIFILSPTVVFYFTRLTVRPSQYTAMFMYTLYTHSGEVHSTSKMQIRVQQVTCHTPTIYSVDVYHSIDSDSETNTSWNMKSATSTRYTWFTILVPLTRGTMAPINKVCKQAHTPITKVHMNRGGLPYQIMGSEE